jgi:dTDP-glucose 4,6-dehydratase
MQSIPEEYSGGPNLLDSRSCYGEAKRFSELLCQVSGVPTVVARLFAFIGPNQSLDGSFAAPDFIRQATTKHEIRIRGNGLAERTYCYSSDLVVSIWKLLLRGEPGEAYNVGQSPPAIKVVDLAQLIGQQIGGVEVIVEGICGDKSRPRYIPDIGKLCQLYRPCITLPEAVERTLWSLFFNKRISISPSNSDLSRLLRHDCQGET